MNDSSLFLCMHKIVHTEHLICKTLVIPNVGVCRCPVIESAQQVSLYSLYITFHRSQAQNLLFVLLFLFSIYTVNFYLLLCIIIQVHFCESLLPCKGRQYWILQVVLMEAWMNFSLCVHAGRKC